MDEWEDDEVDVEDPIASTSTPIESGAMLRQRIKTIILNI
jgi:hypothetical protein